MRIASPDLSVEGQIHQTGIGLINLLGVDLFSRINSELEASLGADWLTNYRKSNLVYLNYNFNDPSNLLKELLRVSTSPLRIPIKSKVPQKDLVAYFNRLQVILDDRNDWVHHNSTFNSNSLKTLILNIYPVADKMDLEVTKECDYLLTKLDGIEPDVPVIEVPIQTQESTAEASKLVQDIKSVIPANDRLIGELIEGKFLEHSYVLHLNGSIRDRKTNQLLDEVRPDLSENLGALLIARKPNGGRLRILSDGTLVAYFEDHWGYIGQVNPDNWFPNHLFHSV